MLSLDILKHMNYIYMKALLRYLQQLYIEIHYNLLKVNKNDTRKMVKFNTEKNCYKSEKTIPESQKNLMLYNNIKLISKCIFICLLVALRMKFKKV